MGYYKIKFLTLNSRKIKDSLYSVNILSRLNGKISIRINGTGKPKSRFSKLNNPGYVCDGTVYLSKEAGNLILSDAEIIEDFSGLRNSMEGLNCISYLTNFIAGLLPEKMRINGYYENAVDFFGMENCKTILKINLFRFYTLHKLGYIPEIADCGNCCEPIVNDAYFSLSDNNIYCANCGVSSVKENKSVEEKKNCFSKNKKDFIFGNDFLRYYKNLTASLKSNDFSGFFESVNDSGFQKKLENFIELFIININYSDLKSFRLLKSINSEFSLG